MKVNVLQVEQATFPFRWSWWPRWVDVAVFDYSRRPYLLQMRVNRMNGKSFRARCITGFFYKQSTTTAIGDLTQSERQEPTK